MPRECRARLVPVVGKAQQRKVAGVERGEDHRKDHPEGQRRVRPQAQDFFQAQSIAPLVRSLVLFGPSVPLVHRSLREVVALRLQVQGAEGLFVLGKVLAQLPGQNRCFRRPENQNGAKMQDEN